MNILTNVTEINETSTQRTYSYEDGTSLTQELKAITRDEAKQKLANYVNSDPCYGAYSNIRGLIYVDRVTKKVVPFEQATHALTRFERLRNYEVERILAKMFNESFKVTGPCPFNG